MINWLRRRLNRRVIEALEQERWELAKGGMQEFPPHPHTQGMYDGLNHAISILETDYR